MDIVIKVKLDKKTFGRFARYDMLWLRRKWVRPALFALIFCGFAAIALASGKPQSGLIGGTLLVVGLGLPAVYIGMFLSQVGRQAKKWGLGKEGKEVYTVTLGEKGFTVVNQQVAGERLRVTWKDSYLACFRADGIYLYSSPGRAFLLPKGQADCPDEEVRERLLSKMGPSKCRKGLFSS